MRGTRRLSKNGNSAGVAAMRRGVLSCPRHGVPNILASGRPGMTRRQPMVHDQHKKSASRELVADIGPDAILRPLVAADKAAARHIEQDRQAGRLGSYLGRLVEIETLPFVGRVRDIRLHSYA